VLGFFPSSYVGFPFYTTKLLVCSFLVECGRWPGGGETCAIVDTYWCRDFPMFMFLIYRFCSLHS